MAEIKPIQSIVRASQIIDCFSEASLELSLSEICKKLQLNKSTLYGLIKTLEQENYLIQNSATKKYRLGIKFVTKGMYATAALNIISVVSPYLVDLNTKYKESANFFLYESDSLHCVYGVGYSSISSMKTEIGTEIPLLASASGKAVLAALPREKAESLISMNEFVPYTSHSVKDEADLWMQIQKIKECGYSIENEEIEIGIESIAAILRNHTGVLGTISLTGPAIRFESQLENMIPDMLFCAKKISASLGYQGR